MPCSTTMLGLCAPFVKLRGTDLVKIRALSSNGLCPATIYLCMAHTEAQAALASWRKAHMEVLQASAAPRRKVHTEAQPLVACGHAPRLVLLLNKTLAVREIYLLC
jgi:hypothetical protein